MRETSASNIRKEELAGPGDSLHVGGFCHMKVRECSVFIMGRMKQGTAFLKSGCECRISESLIRELSKSVTTGRGWCEPPPQVATGLGGPPRSWSCLLFWAMWFYLFAVVQLTPALQRESEICNVRKLIQFITQDVLDGIPLISVTALQRGWFSIYRFCSES